MHPEWDETQRRKMFLLGLVVHDCGYEFSEEQSQHPDIGADMLASCNYEFSEEVRSHGKPDCNYKSEELLILNIADCLTGPQGEELNISERLEDIGKRYGKRSKQYLDASRLADKISGQIAENENVENVRRSTILSERWNIRA